MLDIIFSLLTLTVLEVVLGVDNLVFLAIASSRLPAPQQPSARRVGLTLAWALRLLLLAFAVWLTKLSLPLFTVFDFTVSARDLFLLSGGLFLIVKATQEIHAEMEPVSSAQAKPPASFRSVITQIALFDIVFSLDSILTAVGLTQRYWVMATAISIAIVAMLFLSEPLTEFIHRHPTVKMLALSFLLLIGVILIADGGHYHVPRGYVYFAISFSILVELLNAVRRKRRSENPGRAGG